MTSPVQQPKNHAPVRTFTADALPVRVYKSQPDLAADVTRLVEDYLVEVLSKQGSAAAILATGNSQIKFLEDLIQLGGVDWSKMTLFHMDEDLGHRPATTRPASVATCANASKQTQAQKISLHPGGNPAALR